MVEFGTVRFRAGGHVDEYPVAAGFFECVLFKSVVWSPVLTRA